MSASKKTSCGMIRRTASVASAAALLVAVATASAQGPAAASGQPTAADMDTARRHFQAGLNYLRDPDGEKTEDAYRQFKLAFDISKAPRILGNIGYCALQLERDGEAIAAYTEYLKSTADIDPREREQIQRDLLTLNENSTTVELVVKPEQATLVDSRLTTRGSVANVYGPTTKIQLRIRSGHHVIKARIKGEDRAIWEFDAEPRVPLSHEFDVARAETGGAPAPPVVVASEPSPLPWIALGVGAAALAAGTVTGVIALGKVKTLEHVCANGCPPDNPDYSSDRSSARTFVTLTDSLLIGGVVLTGVGIASLLLRPKSSARASAVNGGVVCTSAGCAGRIQGSF